MAEEKLQEPTEQPTPKRLKEARDKGQIARSRELNTMAITLSAAGAFFVLGDTMLSDFAVIMTNSFELSRDELFETGYLLVPLKETVAAAFSVLTPYLLLMTVIAIFAPMALGGGSFSPSSLKFKGERINPIAGLKRLFALRGLVELVKAMAKFLVVGGVAVLVLQWLSDEFIGLGREPLLQALAHAGSLILIAFVLFSASLILIAALDVPFQLWDHTKKLRMTKQEIREESKETEGRPEVRGRIRALQSEIANRRMMQEIPIASVVVTNPTHFAVALRYEADEMGAPRVVAKGADHLAKRIREVAEENNVPIFEAPPLARILYNNIDIGEEISESLYVGVAQILTYIYQIDQYMAHGGVLPDLPEIDVTDKED